MQENVGEAQNYFYSGGGGTKCGFKWLLLFNPFIEKYSKIVLPNIFQISFSSAIEVRVISGGGEAVTLPNKFLLYNASTYGAVWPGFRDSCSSH